MKHLYDSLRGCAKEEEVKAEFCKFFKMKIFALRGIAEVWQPKTVGGGQGRSTAYL